MKKLFLLFTLVSTLIQANNITYSSDRTINTVYHGYITKPMCINGQSRENGINTQCKMKIIGQKPFYINKIDMRETEEFYEKNKYKQSYIKCKYQEKSQMFYKCKPMSETEIKIYKHKNG